MIEYETNPALQDMVQGLYETSDFTEFEPLRGNGVRVGAVFKIKMKDEELVSAGSPVEIKKSGPLLGVFAPYDYILVFDQYVWHNLPDRRKALIHKALMSIDIKIKASGDRTYSLRKPEISEFVATVVRFGLYHEKLESFSHLISPAITQAATVASSIYVPNVYAPDDRVIGGLGSRSNSQEERLSPIDYGSIVESASASNQVSAMPVYDSVVAERPEDRLERGAEPQEQPRRRRRRDAVAEGEEI